MKQYYVSVHYGSDTFPDRECFVKSKATAINIARQLKERYIADLARKVSGNLARDHAYTLRDKTGKILVIKIGAAYGNPTNTTNMDQAVKYLYYGHWFDQYGQLVRDLPADCVADCTMPGPCDALVNDWADMLRFNVPRKMAINYLKEFGAWSEFELNQKTTKDLSEIVLWIACGDIKESGEWLGLNA